MLDYLKKYNDLPQGLRDRFASVEVLNNINNLEKKYNVSLATVVMRVLIKNIALVDLASFMVFEFSLDVQRAKNLASELNDNVFSVASDYLELNKEKAVDILADADYFYRVPTELVKARETTKTSSFSFLSDSEKEIQELSKKASGYNEIGKTYQNNSNLKMYSQSPLIEKVIGDILRNIGVSFSSDELNNRFKNVLKTYLRGVRNRIDVRQALIRGVDVGGLGLSEAEISKIISKIDEFKKKNEERKIVPPLSSARLLEREGIRQEVVGRDVDYDFSNLKKDISLTTESQSNDMIMTAPEKQQSDIDKKSEMMRQSDLIKSTFRNFSFMDDSVVVDSDNGGEMEIARFEHANSYGDKMNESLMNDKDNLLRSINERAQRIDDRENNAVVMEKVDNKIIDTASNDAMKVVDDINKPEIIFGEKKDDIKIMAPIQPIVQNQIENKKRMDDVKYVPKLVGPIEELRIMNLVSFHRLGEDPKSASKQLMAKINFLAEESYAKKLEGVKAWRQSPLNKLYIMIGQEAIGKEGGVNAIINERKMAKKDFLTNDEFDAIMDLNKNLRF